jgi:hypothetical protein
MDTTRERAIRSIQEAPRRRARPAPGKRPLPRVGQHARGHDARLAADAREALVKRVRSYLDVGSG